MKKNRKNLIKKETLTAETIDHAKKELKMDEKFVQRIMKQEGYLPITKGLAIGKISDIEFLKSKFSCHYQLKKFNEAPQNKQHLVTGFGPTNSPTGGTLSIILRALFFEKETGIDSTIIISNLGAYNSRNINIEKIDYLTGRFIKFIRCIGYNGELRTHNNFDLLVVSSLTSKVLTVKDFLKNKEATVNLYKKLGVLGRDFPVFIDANYTVADILLPVILQKKERVLVFVGIEEYYFPKLANVVLRRFDNYYSEQFTPKNAEVSAIFGHLIQGLNGFPKMSKSIPESSINLDDSYKDLKRKILKCRPEDEKVILQMMTLVSDWSINKIHKVTEAFHGKDHRWIEYKKEYLDYFVDFKKKWNATANKKYYFDVKNLFRKQNDE